MVNDRKLGALNYKVAEVFGRKVDAGGRAMHPEGQKPADVCKASRDNHCHVTAATPTRFCERYVSLIRPNRRHNCFAPVRSSPPGVIQ